ncbi:hypothetical protein GOP47_0012142 [Adiantum capillus-veneris]|uniref:Uncharacterized protein n=1 Tax=Adiantum capillus-veneris TaxID=13818 RepID=A0A9D4UQD8_ADICA|nr:hypothetical protein GOP47_0012142 [Adiantum capillus-veneris]
MEDACICESGLRFLRPFCNPICEYTEDEAIRRPNCRFISESFAHLVSKPDLIELSDVQVFAYKELQVATNDFNEVNVSGRSGFDLVFRGVLADGRMVAIKPLDQSTKYGSVVKFASSKPCDWCTYCIGQDSCLCACVDTSLILYYVC